MTEHFKSWKEVVTKELEDVQKEVSTVKEQQLLMQVRVGELEETTTRRINELVHQAVETESKVIVMESQENVAAFLSINLDEIETIKKQISKQKTQDINFEDGLEILQPNLINRVKPSKSPLETMKQNLSPTSEAVHVRLLLSGRLAERYRSA